MPVRNSADSSADACAADACTADACTADACAHTETDAAADSGRHAFVLHPVYRYCPRPVRLL
jgi:hypothetical protein